MASDRGPQLALFAFLLGMGVLFHQSVHDWGATGRGLALSCLAIFLVLRPGSLGRFLALVVCLGAYVAWDMPKVVNHWMLMGLVSLSALLCTAWAAWRGRRTGAGLEPGALYAVLAPVLRIEVVLMYAFATLAKLNAAFFDPATSCAVSLARQVPFVTWQDWMAGPAIWGTLLLEGGLPLLLLFPRTRIPALAAGFAFHLVLAWQRFVPFSGFVMAFYALFLPDDLPARLASWRAAHPRVAALLARVEAATHSTLAFPLLAGLWLLGAATLERGWLPEATLAEARWTGVRVAFLGYALLVFSAVAAALRLPGAWRYRPGAFRLATPLLLAGPLLVALNGLSPYLGLKTMTSFTMFSGLQTEADLWNSLLPQRMRVFHFQDELVEILDSSDPHLAGHAGPDDRWVPFQFADYASARPEISVSYALGGQVREVARVADDPWLSERPPRLLRHLFWFRPVRPPQPGVCPY